MKKYIKHILIALICFVFITLLNFVLPRLLPGDSIAYLTGFEEEEMTAEMYAYYHHALHLDESIFKQFGYYIKSLFDGTLGYSYKKGAVVSSLIAEKIGYSLQITLPAAIISIIIGLFWGLHAGYKRNSKFDKLSTTALIIWNSIPVFMVALVLVITLCVQARMFPYMGLNSSYTQIGTASYFFDRLYHLILPIFAIVATTIPQRYLLVRNMTAKFMDDKSVSYARQRGLTPAKIKFGYIFKNIAQPFVTMVGTSIGGCFGGSIIIENIFSIGGVGVLLDTAVYTLDYPLMQGILFITTLSIIICVVLSDIICILIDPRVKRGNQA